MVKYKRLLTSYWLYSLIAFILAVAIYEVRSNSPLQQLQRNRNLWASHHISHYRFTLQVRGVESWMGNIEVRNGKEVKGRYNSIVPSNYGNPTIETYFDRILQDIDAKPMSLNVSYDTTYGYPTHIDTMFVGDVPDDGREIFISGLKLLK